jgi:hypothetical protein
MSDNKAVATIFFRVFGVSDLIYSVLYWLYGTFLNLFETQSSFITTALWASTYLALGIFLIALSNRLGGLVVRGLDQPMPPPPPAAFIG